MAKYNNSSKHDNSYPDDVRLKLEYPEEIDW